MLLGTLAHRRVLTPSPGTGPPHPHSCVDPPARASVRVSADLTHRASLSPHTHARTWSSGRNRQQQAATLPRPRRIGAPPRRSQPGVYACAGPSESAIARSDVTILGSHRDGLNLAYEVYSIFLLEIGQLPPVGPLTEQSPCTVGIGLWHALWGVTSAFFFFYCLFACLSYPSAGTHFDRL